ncbi:putative EAL,GGDEF and PAS domains carrying protein [Vibrio nigripulchritudo MADA3029]|uniref:cyclic-guanylate-specific phosphodiesterase n=1 Tax=Vibrio nigripulchritudo TaxID=28173 RepID=U4K1V2_9VIBR|nr:MULTISPECIES: EAL domain-containing protein [Vibrio]EGU55243.1 sensory transduction protein kinase [Vibrio nigripulchritudo ATCC 27043]KJY80517.1 c-di-GMP phosphodiesterase [Vibrio nigripulchritudo]UAB70998.1 EAL domain-containing protein [Vibrio sp. SCSIO 43132]CCN50172.1 putative EAL,GGDEF and PAS domains carrying protein [Vibrio nigripulchritudo MADA3020]CCN55415.1 putative EAL,GGDEF and PAS domains carrying protein [Vibrio nigripulchritudo MADA3021]
MPTEQLQHWFSKLTDHSPFFFAILDRQHNYRMVNARYCEIAGLESDELVGMRDTQVLGEAFYRNLKPYYERAFEGESVEAEITLNDHSLETSLHFSLSPVIGDHTVEYIAFHAIDTSEKQILVRSLEESENKFSKLTELLPNGLLLVEDGCIISANASAARLLGFNSSTELLGEELSRLFIDEKTKRTFGNQLVNMVAETHLTCLTGARCGIERRVSLQAELTSLLGNQSHIVLVQGLDEAANDSSIGQNETHIDSLTKLYNRFGFTKRLEQFIQNETPLVMLYLDIDNFKNINDSLGHHIGDKVIKEVSSRLQRLLPVQAVLGHLGGDEFGIILPEPDHNRTVDQLAERIISLINQPFDLHHFSKRLACSIGSVCYPGDGHDARILLQNADTAMYEAKDRGRNRLIKFNDQMNKEARMRLWLEIELQKALQQNGLEVWYQPKVNARDFSINGAEALVRWKHPVEGYISPGAFIPVAEKAGLIEHLGRVVMREVFSTVKRWKMQGILPGRVAINLSPEQFGNPKLIDYMEKLLSTTELDPSCITFELTESAVMSDSDHTLQMLNAIKNLGFALSIDDFGTGYSSLSYLARFPLDELKIDRAFITDLDTLPKQLTVIENIINLGKSLNLVVVAEGVETTQQATLLSNLNCHSIQGYHFYRPLPKQDIEELLVQNRRHKN